MTASLAGRSLIVASENFVSQLRGAPNAHGLDACTIAALPADAGLPDELVKNARVLVLEVDPESDASLRRMAQLRVQHPDLTIIAALRRADVSLVRTLIRQGIADVADLPFAPDELSVQILDCLSRDAARLSPQDLAPLVTVLRATGGCGATSVLTHLAAALAEINPGDKGVCLIDLDLQGGDAAYCLGTEPRATVQPLLESGERLDEELVRSAITETRFGFSMIAAPDGIAPLEAVDIDQLLHFIRLARSMFDHVLVDLPAAWTDWTLSVAMASSKALLLTDTSISSLRQARRRLDLLASIGVPRSHIGVVVNRLERRLFRAIGTDDVAETLQCEVVAGISAETPGLRSAQDQGLLLFETHEKGHFASDIRALANTLLHSVDGG